MQEIIQAFHLKLSVDDARWFDGGWRDFNDEWSMFNEALDPREVLGGGVNVWGGMMLPDTVPILANGCGDYLCARFRHDGTLVEIVEWNHEETDWKHYGYSIREALALNRWNYQFESQDYSHASLPIAGLSPVAICDVTCATALRNKLAEACLRIGVTSLSNMIGVRWQEFCRWLPYPSEMPASKREQLAGALGMQPEELIQQDWSTALAQAQSALRLRTDLAWPYAVAGRALEHLGHVDEAVKMYEAGARTFCSSASFTREWRGDFKIGSKFAVDRLRELAKESLDPVAREYVDAATNHKLREYWLAQSQAASAKGDFKLAYENLYAAGWDDYFYSDYFGNTTRA
jgi:hypothetical protein